MIYSDLLLASVGIPAGVAHVPSVLGGLLFHSDPGGQDRLGNPITNDDVYLIIGRLVNKKLCIAKVEIK